MGKGSEIDNQIERQPESGDTGGEQKVLQDPTQAMEDNVKTQQKAMSEQKNTDRPPTNVSMKFGRLELMDGDKVEVKGFTPTAEKAKVDPQEVVNLAKDFTLRAYREDTSLQKELDNLQKDNPEKFKAVLETMKTIDQAAHKDPEIAGTRFPNLVIDEKGSVGIKGDKLVDAPSAARQFGEYLMDFGRDVLKGVHLSDGAKGPEKVDTTLRVDTVTPAIEREKASGERVKQGLENMPKDGMTPEQAASLSKAFLEHSRDLQDQYLPGDQAKHTAQSAREEKEGLNLFQQVISKDKIYQEENPEEWQTYKSADAAKQKEIADHYFQVKGIK